MLSPIVFCDAGNKFSGRYFNITDCSYHCLEFFKRKTFPEPLVNLANSWVQNPCHSTNRLFMSYRFDETRECKLRVRSMVGLIPLYACLVIDDEYVAKLPGFKKRMDWFLKNREDLRSEVCKIVLKFSRT